MTERRAMAAERDSTDRYVAAFMEDRVGAIFDARITGVTGSGCSCGWRSPAPKACCPPASLGAEYFRHDERRPGDDRRAHRHALTAWATRSTVKLVEAAPVTGGLRFELAEGGPKPARQHAPAGKPGKPSPEKHRFKPKKR